MGLSTQDVTDLLGKRICPDQWAVVYRTWLTLNLHSGTDATTFGYHIDRVGSVF